MEDSGESMRIAFCKIERTQRFCRGWDAPCLPDSLKKWIAKKNIFNTTYVLYRLPSKICWSEKKSFLTGRFANFGKKLKQLLKIENYGESFAVKHSETDM